jgi:hypothetical protein
VVGKERSDDGSEQDMVACYVPCGRKITLVPNWRQETGRVPTVTVRRPWSGAEEEEEWLPPPRLGSSYASCAQGGKRGAVSHCRVGK